MCIRDRRRFAGACRSKDQRMAKIADMQIEAERRRPFRSRVQERRRVRRIERARAKFLAWPDTGGRYQVRKNAGGDDGPANIRNAMPREA